MAIFSVSFRNADGTQYVHCTSYIDEEEINLSTCHSYRERAGFNLATAKRIAAYLEDCQRRYPRFDYGYYQVKIRDYKTGEVYSD